MLICQSYIYVTVTYILIYINLFHYDKMMCSQYENTPIQIYRKFHIQNQKLKKNQIKNSDIFQISAQNIDCGYSLEPPRRGDSNR